MCHSNVPSFGLGWRGTSRTAMLGIPQGCVSRGCLGICPMLFKACSHFGSRLFLCLLAWLRLPFGLLCFVYLLCLLCLLYFLRFL